MACHAHVISSNKKRPPYVLFSLSLSFYEVLLLINSNLNELILYLQTCLFPRHKFARRNQNERTFNNNSNNNQKILHMISIQLDKIAHGVLFITRPSASVEYISSLSVKVICFWVLIASPVSWLGILPSP